TMASCIERQHEIDHGEAGADQQRSSAVLCKVVDRSTRIITPRIADQPSADPIQWLEDIRLLVADGKNKRLGFNRSAIVEIEAPAAAVALAPHHRGLNGFRATAFDRLVQNPAEIFREEA